MIRDEFDRASAKVVNAYGPIWTQRNTGMLFEEYGWMKAEDWEAVCRRVVMTCGRPPYPSRFQEVVVSMDIRKPGIGGACTLCDGKLGKTMYLRRKNPSPHGPDYIHASLWEHCSCVRRPEGKKTMDTPQMLAEMKAEEITENEYLFQKPRQTPIDTQAAVDPQGGAVDDGVPF